MQRYFAINKNLELSKNDLHHIINVMKMKTNERFNIIYDNKIYECNIDEINKKDVKYSILNSSLIIKISNTR
jgi:RsmE family RNA methyltransferase